MHGLAIFGHRHFAGNLLVQAHQRVLIRFDLENHLRVLRGDLRLAHCLTPRGKRFSTTVACREKLC